MRSIAAFTALCALLMGSLIIAAAPGAAAVTKAEPASEASLETTNRVPRIETAPVIDGRLNEPAWDDAAVIDDFTQVDPREGAEPTERTVIRLLYDRDAFYIGIRAHDSRPDGVLVKELQRDERQNGSDWVAVVLDTFFDQRNGFFFQINPGGARRDALVEDQSNIRYDWDGLWDGRAVRDDKGWSAEIAIPFKTVSFNPDSSRWGFNAQRFIRRKNETIRWRAAKQDRSIISLQHAGVLRGLYDRDQGLGVDVKPSLTFRHRDNSRTGTQGLDIEPALDVFYKPHPTVTAALTLNTDFAQTEVDERRVNLTRFPLFFPEKRAFFLQDAGIFDFGGLNRSPLPFFSRRIGIGPRGGEQEIRAGLKVTGRTQRFNFGLLDVQMADDPTLGSKNLAVGRLSANVLEESTVGIVATRGDPTTTGDNRLIGADFNYRNSQDFGDATVTSSTWIEHTSSSGEAVVGDSSEDVALGSKFNYSSDTWSVDLAAEHIGDNLNPALGFVRRLGVRQYFSRLRHRWRFDGPLERLDMEADAQVVTNLDDHLETLQLTPLRFTLENTQGDWAQLSLEHRREDLFEPFEINDGVVIPTGSFDWERGRLRLRTSEGRALRGTTDISFGDFFTGSRWDVRTGVEWRASRHFFASAEFERNHVELPQGEFTTDIARARVNIAFTPDLAWNNLLQYDNVSEMLSTSSRVQWIVEPGNEVFLVFRQNFREDGERFERVNTTASAKAGLTLRF